jgi:hypothetical protein
MAEHAALLMRGFPEHLASFERRPPFNKAQFEAHRATLDLRLKHGTVVRTLRDDKFFSSLYETLKLWRIGVRRSRLVPLEAFARAIRSRVAEIEALEGLSIDDLQDAEGVSARLWCLIESLSIVDNDATVVAGTKALHHLLPELVVPIDRAYTATFFGWHDFQYQQRRSFSEGFLTFAVVAREVRPQQFVGAAWNTSRTKVLDNAVVGLLVGLGRLPPEAG